MKTKLFENDQWTAEGSQIHNEFEAAVRVVFEKYKDTHSIRDLQYAADSAVASVGLDLILTDKEAK